jgi:large subunit ribosomal protein L4|tara:strand:- start:17187 stop:17843 length:657 start_codon:yes stop_codon:yes gene_type:complete
MTDIKTISYSVYKKTGEKTSTEKSLKLKVSDLKANYLIHKSLLYQNHNNFQKTASTKTRSEVRGGGRKPWKQKGTGRARAGSNNSPLWKGGGVIFGPKPIKANKKLNKKEWKLSIRTLLYNKKQSLLVLDSFDDLISSIKTKQMLEVFNNLNISSDKNILLVSNSLEDDIHLSVRNLENVVSVRSNNLDVKNLLRSDFIVVDEQGLKIIEETYCDSAN